MRLTFLGRNNETSVQVRQAAAEHRRNWWLRGTLVAAFAVLAFLCYFAGSKAGQSASAGTSRHAPGPDPDRIILTWSGNPATTQSVTWRTSTGIGKAKAEIAVAEDGPDFAGNARAVEAGSRLLTTGLVEAMYHTVSFTGLLPGTLYAYRVGDGSNWSEWNQFRTAAAGPAPLTFLYVGDAQNSIYEHWSRVIRMGFSEAPKANFILHAGDLVNRGSRDADWGEWFQAAGWIDRSVASFPTPGNHEYDKDEQGERRLTEHWRAQFALPENGPPGLEESCYYTDIHGVRMISLNSNEQREAQAAWLDTLLADNPNRWTIITFHHPVFSSSRGRDNKELRELWKPLFDKHAVDLVLQGHDHSYARSNLVSGVNTRSGGTVYVVSVSGPKQYQLERASWMKRVAERTQLFQVIRVEGDKLAYEARTATGSLYDAFELRKGADGANQLVDRTPPLPERFDESGAE